MAIAKIVTHESGVQSAYHRIDALQWKRGADHFDTLVVIGSYLNQEAADSGLAPVAVGQTQLNLSFAAGEPTRRQVYALLTAPIAQHSYEEEVFGDRDDGSRGPVAVPRTVDDARSVTGFNDCAEA